jgi:hypothetical protein
VKPWPAQAQSANAVRVPGIPEGRRDAITKADLERRRATDLDPDHDPVSMRLDLRRLRTLSASAPSSHSFHIVPDGASGALAQTTVERKFVKLLGSRAWIKLFRACLPLCEFSERRDISGGHLSALLHLVAKISDDTVRQARPIDEVR